MSAQNVLCQSKLFCASTKTNFTECKSFLDRHKTFWTGTKYFVPTQNILRLVKGRGISGRRKLHQVLVYETKINFGIGIEAKKKSF